MLVRLGTWGVIFGLPRIRIKLRGVRCLKICEPRPYGLYSIDLYLGHLGMLNCIGESNLHILPRNAQKQIGFGQLHVTSKTNWIGNFYTRNIIKLVWKGFVMVKKMIKFKNNDKFKLVSQMINPMVKKI